MFKHYDNINEKLNEYVTIIAQDVDGGIILDTTVNINTKITVAGDTIDEFAKEIKKIIEKYRI